MLLPETVNNYETPVNHHNNPQETSLLKNKNNFQIFCKDISKINDFDECGWTPLYRSVIAGDISSTTFLLNKGADPNIKCTMGETPLYQAVEMEKLDIIKLLLKKGADPNITNDDDLSPLHAAVNKQNILIVKTLLKYGANPNIKSKLYQQTPLHLAIKNNTDPMILLLLVQFNGSLIKEDKFNKKPVDYTNSKEMQSTIEKLKFGKEELKIEKNEKKYETPAKKFAWTPSNVYTNTIRSKSKGREFAFGESNAVLKNPGNVKLTIIDRKNNIFSNDKLEQIENTQNNKEPKNELLDLNDNKINKIKNIENKENINNNIEENLNIDSLIEKKNKSLEESIELDNINLNCKDIDYSLLRKITGKVGENQKDRNYNILNKYNISNTNIIRPKSMYLNNQDIESSSINDINNNQNKPIHFSFSSNTFKINKNKSNIYNSAKENESNKENINDNINHENPEKDSRKTFKKQTNNNNKEKKKIILKKYYNQEEKGDINKSKINKNKFNPNNCLYEKIVTKSVTKIEIYDDSKESISQIIKKDSTMEDSKIKSTNKSLYNKPILKPLKINNLKKIIKNDNYRPSLSTRINKSIISADNGQLRKKNIFMKKEKIRSNRNSILSYDKKNNEANITTINSERNKNYNKNKSMSRASLTTLTASGNEYLRNNNIKNNQSNYQNNLWKFVNDIPYNDKIMYQSSLSNNLISEISNEYISNNKFPIYEWLKEIGLHCYYNLFIEKKIFNMEKVITNLKSGKYILNKMDIEKIGIIIHGHIYRILTKLEIDSEKINEKISNLVTKVKNKSGRKEINVMNNSIYFCCGCCTNNERKIINRIKKDFNLEKWLNKINMIKYKEHFIENGFDLFEYFILQMFSTIPIDDHILKEELGIENDKDRDIILLRLNKDVKYIMLKLGRRNENEISIDDKKLYEFDTQTPENKSECIII